MTLEVIGAGFGRTGTLSMKAALETLDYDKCHHMVEVFGKRGQIDYWEDIAQGALPDWDEVFDGYKACVDFPACIFYRKLMDKYPDAKVILTVRSADSWYKSVSNTIYRAGTIIPAWFRLMVPRLGRSAKMVDKLIWAGVFKDRFEDEDFAKQVFLDHIEMVKATVPPEKLLVFEARQGWGPLCAFLDKPEPEGPFPHVNDTAEFEGRIRMMKLIAASPFILGAALLAVGAYFAFH